MEEEASELQQLRDQVDELRGMVEALIALQVARVGSNAVFDHEAAPRVTPSIGSWETWVARYQCEHAILYALPATAGPRSEAFESVIQEVSRAIHGGYRSSGALG